MTAPTSATTYPGLTPASNTSAKAAAPATAPEKRETIAPAAMDAKLKAAQTESDTEANCIRQERLALEAQIRARGEGSVAPDSQVASTSRSSRSRTTPVNLCQFRCARANQIISNDCSSYGSNIQA